MPTTAVPTSTISLPASIIRDRGEAMRKARNLVKAQDLARNMELEKLKRVETAAKPDKYQRYLQALAADGIVSEALGRSFFVNDGNNCDHAEYEPWIILLEALFPKLHDLRVSEEQIVTQTYYSKAEEKQVQQIDPFILVRKRATNGTWPVVLLAMGYGQQDPSQLEDRFPSVVEQGAQMVQRLMDEHDASQSVALLAFFCEALHWSSVRAGSAPVRHALLRDVRDKSAEATLLQIAEFVRTQQV